MAYADENTMAEIRCTLHVGAQFIPSFDEERRETAERSLDDYVPATAFAIDAMTTRLFGEGVRARYAVQTLIRRLQDWPRDDDDKDDGPPVESPVSELLWEFFDNVGFHPVFVVESVAVPLQWAIDGHVGPFQLGFWGTRSGPYPPVRLECVAVEFAHGSFRGKFITFAKGTAAVLTLVFAAAATPQAINILDAVRVEH